MRGTDLDRFDNFFQIDSVAFGENGPFVHKGQQSRSIAVFDDLCSLRLYGPVEHGQGILLRIQDLVQENNHPISGHIVDSAADTPEIPNRGHIVPSGHDPFVAVSEKRLGCYSAFGEFFSDNRVDNLLRCSRRNCGLDEDQSIGRSHLSNKPECVFKGNHVNLAIRDIAESVLDIVALNIDNYDVRILQGFFHKGGPQAPLFFNASIDKHFHIGIF